MQHCFSFKYNELDCWENLKEISNETSGNVSTTTYAMADGLQVKNIYTTYPDFGAIEWVNHWENTGSKDSGIISELWDCCYKHLFINGPARHPYGRKIRPEECVQMFAPCGSDQAPYEFYSEFNRINGCNPLDYDYPIFQDHLFPTMVHNFAPVGGRSSDERAPFFHVHDRGRGFIAAVGWTGQWNAQISCDEEGVQFNSKIGDTHFYLMPGEKIRTSSVLIMSYEGTIIDGHNQWRRLLKTHFSPKVTDGCPPVSMMLWGAWGTETTINMVNAIQKDNIPVDYVWMDAGWYGGGDERKVAIEAATDWASCGGDWNVNRVIHPGGLLDVSKAIQDAGLKFLLWFEPEQIHQGVPIVEEHPEYLIPPVKEGESYLLNIGDPAVFAYCYNLLAEKIRSLNIRCYRNDFNFRPLSYWQSNDTPDRQGITEIKYISNLYALWDKLLAEFPGLVIDNCSSGGRRIDIELHRRSIALWRSDAQCDMYSAPELAQTHGLTFPLWVPYAGAGAGTPDENDVYQVRSGYASTTVFRFWDIFKENFNHPEWVRKYCQEYRSVQPYMWEDFYPLTQPTYNSDTWCAWQYNRPSGNDGIVQAFRRSHAPANACQFPLFGLDADACYSITDADTQEEIVISGMDLLNEGLDISIAEKRGSKLFFYKKIS